ncbi:MAG: alpha/beta hydrolase [Anaerolineales bacterium]|nr:alpha/beta hydrolase [Anaerolineales bacterium]
MFISLEDAKIFTVAFGPTNAPPVLGIGGWIGSWELWAGPFSFLSADWRVIVYDHRGSGATDASLESITLDRLVEDVIAVMDHFQVENCVLAAESAGALVAISTAIRYPQRIRGLVLVDGYYFNPTPENQDPFLAGLRAHYPQTIEAFVQACIPENDCEHIKRWGRQILQRASPEAALALYRLTIGVDLRPALSSLEQSTLLIHGEADPLVPLQAAQWLANRLPHAELVVLNGAGHVPTMTRPKEVAHAMDQFLKRIHPDGTQSTTTI